MIPVRLLLRLVLLLPLCFPGLLAAEPPAELLRALSSFRTEGPFGWAFTQNSSDGNETLTESFDPSKAEPFRWTLEAVNGRQPTAEELQRYQQRKLVRTSALDAPRLERQLDSSSFEQVSLDEEHLVGRCRLKPGEEHDKASLHLSVLLTLHRPSGTLRRVVIENRAPFSPVFGIRIQSSRTELDYSLPDAGAPSLLLRASIRLQGTAFWVKDIGQSLEITWTGHRRVGRQPPGEAPASVSPPPQS